MTVSHIYSGSRLLLPLSNLINLPIDQLNYVTAQFSALCLGFVLRWLLPHSLNRPMWRYLYCLGTGLAVIFFVIGWQALLVLLQVAVSYLIMLKAPERSQALAVFFFAMGYMLMLYAWRVTLPMEQLCYDATFALMITTQKLTTLAFSLSDWRVMGTDPERAKTMDAERKLWALRKVPGPLEYFSFNLAYQGILAGPFCHFKAYRAFIHGHSTEQDNEQAVSYKDHPRSCVTAVVTKLMAVFFWIGVTMLVRPHFPDTWNVDPEFIGSHGVLYRLSYLWVSQFLNRGKYYVVWILAEAVYNASGVGYQGMTQDGRHDWSGISNVNVLNIESATSLKAVLDNWNITTARWLRHVCYARVPFQRTLLTFVLSALWHGLHGGYYLTFISAAVFVEAGRKIHTHIRPLFQASMGTQRLYAVVTYLFAQLGLAFLVTPFVTLNFWPSITFFNSLYWSPHIFCVLVLAVLPGKRKPAGKPQHNNHHLEGKHQKQPEEQQHPKQQ